jgi:hypothetical protein
MLRLFQIWNKASGAGPTSPAYDSATILLTEGDLKDDQFDANDPDVPEFLRERKKERQREIEANLEFEHRQAAAEKREHEKEEKEGRLHEWLASEQYRRAFQQLCDDIADARQATQWAYERARKEEEKARKGLEEAQRNALVVSGNRVYFTRDGSRLYGEGGAQITDRATVEEAKRQHAENPKATSYEDFVERRDAHDQTANNLKKLRDSLDRLDDLDKRVKDGQLTPEELAQARKDKQEIIDSLPPEAKQEYERLHAARKDADDAVTYRGAETSFDTAPDMNADFQRAAADRDVAPPEDSLDQESPARTPAYKAAPDF